MDLTKNRNPKLKIMESRSLREKKNCFVVKMIVFFVFCYLNVGLYSYYYLLSAVMSDDTENSIDRLAAQTLKE